MKISVQAVQCLILSSLLVDKAVSFVPASIKASSLYVNKSPRNISKSTLLNSSKNDNDESESSSSSSGTKVVNELVSLFETVNTKQQNYDTENARLKFQLNDILSKYDQSLQDQIALQDTSNALKGQIDTLTQRMQIIQAEADRNVNLLQTRNDAMKLVETQKRELEKQLRLLESEQTLRLQSIATANQDIQKLQLELKQQTYESQEMLKSKEKEYEFSSSRLQFQLEEITTKYEQAKKDQYALQDIVDSLKRMKQELNQEIVQFKTELSDNRQIIESKDGTISDLQQRISTLENSLKDMENEKTIKLKEIALMNQEMEKLQVQVSIQETQLLESQKDASQVAARITGEAETEKFKLKTLLSARTREMDELKQKMQSMNQEIFNVKREADEKMKKMEMVSNLVQKDLEAKSRQEKRKIKQKMWKIATKLEDEKLKLAVLKQKNKEGETKQKAEYEKEMNALQEEKSKIIQDLQDRLATEESFYEQAKQDFTQALLLLQSDFIDQESILEAIERDESQKATKNLLVEVTSARSKKMMEDLQTKYATDISSLEETLKKEREANARTKKELEKTIQELTDGNRVQQDISTNQQNALKTAMMRKIEELEEQAKAKEMFYAKAKMDFAKNLSKYSKKVTYLKDTLESERNFNSIKKVKLEQKVERLTKRNNKLEANSTKTLKKLKSIEKKYDEDIKNLQDTLEKERRTFEEERERLEKQISDMSIKFAQEKKQLEDELSTQLITARNQFQQEIENVKQALKPRISDLTKELNEVKENARSEINELKVNHTIELETSKKIANTGKIKIEELVAERDELIRQSEEKSIDTDYISENNNSKRKVDMDKIKEKLKEIEIPSSKSEDAVTIETKLEMNKSKGENLLNIENEDSMEVRESTEESKMTKERITDRNKTTGLYDKLINKQKNIIRRKAIGPALIVGAHSASLPLKYCHGTSLSCESDEDCSSSQCTYPFEWTADSLPNQGYHKQVKVFIMMGQSNNVGYGEVGPKETEGTLRNAISKGEYPHLVGSINQETGDVKSWSERKNVRIVYNDNDSERGNVNLKVGWDNHPKRRGYIGPEIQFGHMMGHAYDHQVLIIKVGTGGRSLGWDFLPPDSSRYVSEDTSGGLWSYPGHGGCPERSVLNATLATESDCNSCQGNDFNCPVYWASEEECSRCHNSYYAGWQFDEDAKNAKQILSRITQYIPGYRRQGIDIEGFVFVHGWNDSINNAYSSKYRENIKRYIEAIDEQYKEYSGAKKFVLATIGHNGYGGFNSRQEEVFQAQMSVDGSLESEFEGKVKVVDSRPFWVDKDTSPADSFTHYNNNANSYMSMGEALGEAMIELLPDRVQNLDAPTSSPSTSFMPSISLSPSASPSHSFNPTVKPSLEATTIAETCHDSPLRMKVFIESEGKEKMKSCSWAGRVVDKVVERCNLPGVSTHCPISCGTTCNDVDSEARFKIEKPDGKKINRYCSFVAKNPSVRCTFEGVTDTCRETCH